MTQFNETIHSGTFPVIPLRGTVAFPAVPISIEPKRDKSCNACRKASENDGMVLLLAQKDAAVDEPSACDLYTVGTVARIKQSIKTPDGGLRLILETYCRAQIEDIRDNGSYLEASVLCKTIEATDNGGLRGEAMTRQILDTIAANSNLGEGMPAFSDDLLLTLSTIKNPGLLCDFIGANILRKVDSKQQILACFDPLERMELLTVLLEQEFRILRVEAEIRSKVRERMDENQEDYYLREQLKVIEEELGEEGGDEGAEYRAKIEALSAPQEIKDKLLKETARLSKAPYGSAEGGVLRSYLDICLEIPFGVRTQDRDDLDRAEKILNADHDGMKEVKERILEFLAVKKYAPDLGGQILCLVGPPGVGKTSIASSIARALNRKFVRVSLGGIRDEADIRGHRKTYVAAMPGRIIEAVTHAGCLNPVILLDEVDKLTRDAHGDPASALLEVLDPEQNRTFRDHFVEMPLDLSDCLFIATANTLSTVPEPLIDRMEILELSTYTRSEKISIAKHHLIPKQRKRHGFGAKAFSITDGALRDLIDYYTREAGVRNLEREIARLCRKAARVMREENKDTVKVTEKNLTELLGPHREIPEEKDTENRVGVVNGLAYTASGGDMLKIEAAAFAGSGKLETTGQLGDVMKESARIALDYLRSAADRLKLDDERIRQSDIHLHVPEGAVPKDGPSAGVTMMTCLYSLFSGKAVRADTAMTGEITLTGRVLPIGGLREKTMAALAAGITRVIVPRANLRDRDKLDPQVLEKIELIPVTTADEVLQNAIVGMEQKKAETKKRRSLSGAALHTALPRISGAAD